MSYRIQGPALLSISAGRSSGRMLHAILDAHGGQLPPDVFALFTDTGKEFPAAYEFLGDMERAWGVKIHRAEYPRGEHATPFDAVLADHPQWGLPGPGQHSWCSTELKTRIAKKFAGGVWIMSLRLKAGL